MRKKNINNIDNI